MSKIKIDEIKHLVKLKVYRGLHFAGILSRTKQGCELTFTPEFLAQEKYSELTYRIKKSNSKYVWNGANLPSFFAGLLPEGLRLKALVKELKTSEDDLFSLLVATGERSVGDVYTTAEAIDRPEPKIQSIENINFYEFFEQNLNSAMLAKGEEGIAGVQEKISSAMIGIPVQIADRNKSYILKLNPKDKPNLTSNELNCLELAKKCGIEVNKAQMVFDKNNNSGLLIERFDRVKVGNTIQRIHQEDACQFLDRYPADKYRLSFQEICSGIQDLATAPQIEVLKTIQLYLFSYLIGNGDLHAKNISLQTEPDRQRIQLTPAYDLICTYLYKDQKMALKLDGQDTKFSRKHFLTFGERYDLPQKAVRQTIDKLLSRLQANHHYLLEILGLSTKESSLLERMLKARAKSLL